VSIVYLNGKYLDREQASLPLDDRGFLFGDGVYEVCRAVEGRLFALDAHWSRLQKGLAAIAIDCRDRLDAATFAEIAHRLLERNDLRRGHATVYLQVTRGAAPRTHAYPPAGTPPTVYAYAAPFRVPTELREAGAGAITLPDLRWARCDIKSVNLLPNVMAKQRAVEAGAFEAVLVREGVVTEGASSNVFGVIGGELRTHPATPHILHGITRSIVLEMARELGIAVREEPLLSDDLLHVEELFATGTTTDVQPLVRLDGHVVGSGAPGEITRALWRALEERMLRH